MDGSTIYVVIKPHANSQKKHEHWQNLKINQSDIKKDNKQGKVNKLKKIEQKIEKFSNIEKEKQSKNKIRHEFFWEKNTNKKKKCFIGISWLLLHYLHTNLQFSLYQKSFPPSLG
jgi:hypothetical protein